MKKCKDPTECFHGVPPSVRTDVNTPNFLWCEYCGEGVCAEHSYTDNIGQHQCCLPCLSPNAMTSLQVIKIRLLRACIQCARHRTLNERYHELHGKWAVEERKA